MPPRRSNHVNNKADHAFTAAVVQAVADLLPTLTARIIDEIRQNENNGNNVFRLRCFDAISVTFDPFLGRVLQLWYLSQMPPRRSNHVNNKADPAFTAAVVQAVADLLPTLIDEIRQNENNGNNGNRRNARRVNTEGLGNDEDA
nr:hypothetical protein [Tanacetum cinerariifolium]